MNNPSHEARPTEKIWEQNPDFFFLRFFLYSLGNTMFYNTGVLKISHNCGVEERTERLFEIFFFFCLIYTLLKIIFD